METSLFFIRQTPESGVAMVVDEDIVSFSPPSWQGGGLPRWRGKYNGTRYHAPIGVHHIHLIGASSS